MTPVTPLGAPGTAGSGYRTVPAHTWTPTPADPGIREACQHCPQASHEHTETPQ